MIDHSTAPILYNRLTFHDVGITSEEVAISILDFLGQFLFLMTGLDLSVNSQITVSHV